MLRKPALKMQDFSGGLITRGPSLGIEANQSPDCLNTHSHMFKTLKKRKGYTKLNSVSQAATTNGIYNYIRGSSEQYLVSLWSTTLKKMDVVSSAWDGTWDTITKGNYGTTLDSNFMYNTSFNGDCLITTESRSVPQKYDPNDNGGKYTDLDWETSHCYVVGNVDAVTPNPLITKSYLKITIDGTVFDDVDLDGDTSIANVVASINAHTGLAAKGFAVEDSSGYLRIYSNTRGATGSVVVADGSNDNQETTEILFSGTTSTGTTITTNIVPSGKYIIIWQDKVIIANTVTDPDRWYYSGSADATSWSATDYEDIVTSQDVGITGLATLRGRLYVFKKKTIHRVTYLGGTPLFDIRECKSSVGTQSPRSIINIEIPGEGEVLLFFGSDKQWYKFDGYSALSISESVSSYNGTSNYCLYGDGSTYGLNPAKLTEVHAVNYNTKHWAILFFCLDNDTTPKDAFIYDYFSKSFWPFHFNDVFNVSCIADNGAGQDKVYVAGTNTAWLFDNGNNDDSAAINGYFVTSKLDFGSEVILKSIRSITLTTDSVACTPTFQYLVDWSSTWSDAETLVTSTYANVFDIPVFEELLQWKIVDNSTSAGFEVIRASIVAQTTGANR